MIELMLTAILLGSLAALGVILYRKISLLAKMPEVSTDLRADLIVKVKKSMGWLPGAKTLDYELYLQKVLSKVRILTLKTENKTGSWLEKLRQRNNRKNNRKPDDYWDELKKIKGGK